MRNAAVVLIVLVLAALALPAGLPAATPRDTIVLGTTDKIAELDPANSYDYWTWHVLQNTAEALVAFKPGTTQIVPGLATSWTTSGGGTVYTFTLRRGVTFTDGAPFNAQAVKWSFDRAFRLKGPEGALGLIENIKSVEAVNPTTVRFTLKAPDATFLSRISESIGISLIVSPRTTPANAFAKGKYAGTGPYRLAQYTPGQRTVYEAYERYWGPKPKSRRVITVFYADSAALAAAVQSGQADLGYRTFSPEDIKRLQGDARLQVIKSPSFPSVRYIVFNVTVKPFDNVKVRRAIAYAVNRDRIVTDVFGGLNQALYTMVPPGMWSSQDAFPRRDLSRAKALLGEAGYSETNKLNVTLWYTPTHYGNTEADAAAVLKSSLEETGIVSVEVKSSEWGDYTKAMAAGQFGMFLLGWFPDFVDPDNFLAPWLVESPEGLGTYLNKATSVEDKRYYGEFQKLLGDAKRTTNQSTRTAAYRRGQQLLAESAILVPLWQNLVQSYVIAQKNVRGITLDATTIFRTYLLAK
ncbi:MAG TPA: ABC transporter substrate-binding protein [Dehalococcoidia bacterium]|nr:ABC transporter substrate-binding protein [Dehalococcoidia bacterium]